MVQFGYDCSACKCFDTIEEFDPGHGGNEKRARKRRDVKDRIGWLRRLSASKSKDHWANTILPYRSPSRIPGRWPSVAHRCQPHPQALPHARLRSQRGRRQEQILVLLVSAEKGQEGKRRDRYPQPGTTILKPIQCYLPEMGCSDWR